MKTKSFLFALLLLAGCGHINLAEAVRLRSLNVMSLDPAETQARAKYPAGWGVKSGSFAITISGENDVTGEKFNERFPLSVVENGDPDTWGFDKATQNRLEETRTKITSWKESVGRKAHGVLSVGIELCAQDHADLLGDYSLYIRPSADIGFLGLVTEQPVGDLIKKFDGNIPSCE
jgi:hypothetical protein